MDTVDVVVAGSGAAGMTAAIVAARAGLRVVLLEKTAFIGGTTAWSGGVAWVPGNHLMTAAGIEDSARQATDYVRAIAGTRMNGLMVQAFLSHCAQAFQFLHNNTTAVRFVSSPNVDYYPYLPGATSHRGLAVAPYEGRALGAQLARLQMPLRQLVVFRSMQVDIQDIYHLQRMFTSARSLIHGVRLMARYGWDCLSVGRGARLIRGNALAARLYRSALDLGVTVLHCSPVTGLLHDGPSVSGVTYRRDGQVFSLKATGGVILATGGVSANEEFRQMLMPHPQQHVSMLPDGNCGDGVRLGQSAGAVLGQDKVKNACLTPVSLLRERDGTEVKYPHLAFDRCKPGSIIVNAGGQRFTNEAGCYHDVVTAMHTTGAVPAWLVGDRPFLRRYGMGMARPFPYLVRPLVRSGYLLEAQSLAGLAQQMGVEPAALEATVARFNAHALRGEDVDFKRGGDSYSRSLGDPEHLPNPSLGVIERGPFYALKLLPGDVGTFRGLQVNTDAQVVDAHGAPVTGLYACGLDIDSVFSGYYPGAGAMHGPNITFAYIAARHIATACGMPLAQLAPAQAPEQ